MSFSKLLVLQRGSSTRGFAVPGLPSFNGAT